MKEKSEPSRCLSPEEDTSTGLPSSPPRTPLTDHLRPRISEIDPETGTDAHVNGNYEDKDTEKTGVSGRRSPPTETNYNSNGTAGQRSAVPWVFHLSTFDESEKGRDRRSKGSLTPPLPSLVQGLGKRQGGRGRRE